MVDVDISIIFAGLSIAVSIMYYASVIRNQNKTQQMQLDTRQAQLFMQLYNRLDKDFSMSWFTAAKREWDDYDDYQEKYGWRNNLDAYNEWNAVATYLEGIGVLVREGFVDVRLVALLMSGMIRMFWEKFNTIILEFRRRENFPRYLIEVEYLYEALMEYSQKHPELGVQPQTD